MRWIVVFLGILIVYSLTWIGIEVRRARRQEAAVKAIERLGGYACLDYQTFSMDLCPPDGRKPLPSFVYALFGEHFATHVKEVVFYFDVATPTRVGEWLEGFSMLRRLTLRGAFISSDMSELSGLGLLEHLDLGNTPISKEGLASLPKFKHLKSVILPETVGTDDIRALRSRMPQCEISVFRGNVYANPKTLSRSSGSERVNGYNKGK